MACSVMFGLPDMHVTLTLKKKLITGILAVDERITPPAQQCTEGQLINELHFKHDLFLMSLHSDYS